MTRYRYKIDNFSKILSQCYVRKFPATDQLNAAASDNKWILSRRIIASSGTKNSLFKDL